MEQFTPWSSLAGGALIGLAAAVLYLVNGRIAGISGMIHGLLTPAGSDKAWRGWFLAGLVVGGAVYVLSTPLPFTPRSDFPVPLLALAGFLVGLGTRMGRGCTSGHGVCGLARLSPRSVAATATFLLTAILTYVLVTRHIPGAAV